MSVHPLHGTAALITGGARGIGRAIALALAGAGADVAIGYLERADAASATVSELEAFGVRALAVQGDVSRREDVRRVIATVKAELGGIDALVNNAGLLQQKPFAEISDADWERVMSVNLKGPFMCCQEALPIMRPRGGRIVNVASSGGQLGGPLGVHYSASKSGVIALTRSLARVAAPSVTVNCISPGLIDTEMTQSELGSSGGRTKLGQIPLERPGLPEEVAAAALFLLTTASYLTGQTINVNGGLYFG